MKRPIQLLFPERDQQARLPQDGDAKKPILTALARLLVQVALGDNEEASPAVEENDEQ